MKYLLSILATALALVGSAYGQVCVPSPTQTCTSNVGLALPNANSSNWNVPLNQNFSWLDSLLSGNALVPQLDLANLDNILYVDGVKYPTIQAAINALPSSGGEVVIPPGTYTASSPITITNPATKIAGAGSQSTFINCTGNGDCFNIRTSPFTISPGFGISGLSIIGTGSSNANAVGIHTGDMVGGHFEDLQIDNFLGTNSSCFWADNQSGWWERNLIENVELGIHGETQSGCTKELRFTVNGGDTSFGYNDFYGLRLSPAVSGQIGISIEGTSSFYKEVLVGNANMVPGTTLISASGSANGNGNFINLRVECTILGGCAAGSVTGWSISSVSVSLHYAGPGIVTGGDPAIVNLVTQPEVLVSEYSVDRSSFRPDIAGQETFRLNTLSTTPGQINESIGLSSADAGGFGGVVGNNIQHPIVWGYAADTNCFEVYAKNFQIPLTSSNRKAAMPCGSGTTNSLFGLTLNSTSGVYQSKRAVSGCTTTASIGGICGTAITVTWSNPFADTSYSAGCSASGIPTNLPASPYIVSKSAASMTVNYYAISAAAASWATIDCWAIHD